MKTKRAIKQLKALKKYAPDSMRLAAEWNKPWHVLISTILSARTRDETTIAICAILFKKYESIKMLANASLKDVKKIILPVNFYKTKAKNIIACARVLVEKYNSNPPHDFNKLMELSGVGRKTSNVFLAVMGKPAIGVDVHVGQISRKLGWTNHKEPWKVEKDLQALFPKRYWRSINYILVRVGRTYRGKKEDELIEKIKEI